MIADKILVEGNLFFSFSYVSNIFVVKLCPHLYLYLIAASCFYFCFYIMIQDVDMRYIYKGGHTFEVDRFPSDEDAQLFIREREIETKSLS